MNLRIFLLGITVVILISLISLIVILTNIDPYKASILYPILFYLSFFIAVFGIFTLAGFYLRKLVIKHKIPARLFKTSLTQGILISLILTIFLILRSFRIL